MNRPQSAALHQRARQVIPGGMVSLNRRVEPEIAFVRGQGSRLWDADGNEYLDYHAAFAPILLGHAFPEVEKAVARALADQQPLSGSGTTPWEIRAAELIVQCAPSVEQVQLTTSGSEATYHAIRLSRAFTGRNDVVLMQGGYNGWHDDVACNVMTPLEVIGPRVSPGEYPHAPLTAGMPAGVAERTHVINFNDLASLEWALANHPVACVLMEPILQNIGLVKPEAGYLQGVRDLCTRHGVLLVFDEIKTGFRHALGGYQSICGVHADLTTFGKALANGYPLGAVGGRADIMGLFDSPDPAKRVLIAGTYNGHPVPVAATIATLELLSSRQNEVYGKLELLGAQMEAGLQKALRDAGITGTVVRQGSAFCVYFMDHAPLDWHDLAQNQNFDLDVRFRRGLIDEGVYVFPLATKQCSISFSHKIEEVERTIEAVRRLLSRLALE